MNKMIKKVVLAVMAFLILAFSVAPTAYAAASTPSTWYNQSFQEWYTKVNDAQPSEIFGERYTAAQVQWVIYGLFYFIMNGSTNGNNKALGCVMAGTVDQACFDSIKELLSMGGTVNSNYAAQPKPKSFLASVFADRPLSGVTYLKTTARNLHIIPQVSAAQTGFGFSQLDPILPVWRVFRNIAFILFTLIIVAMAFMIMFRVKISPQTVITVQSALPKIAIALILITFSYAIAGFMIDLMYVVIGLISAVFSVVGVSFFFSGNVASNPAVMFDFLTKGIIPGLSAAPFGIFGILMMYMIYYVVTLAVGLFAASFNVASLGQAVLTLGGSIAGPGILALVVAIILLIVFIIAFVKILWMLVKAFANILLLTIFSPLQIAVGAISTSGGIGGWLKNLAGNLAVFPVTGVLFILGFYFLGLSWNIAMSPFVAALGQKTVDALNTIFNNLYSFNGVNVTPNGWPPFLGVGQKEIMLVYLGVSLAILLIIPKAANIIQSFMAGKPFEFGTAIGEAMGPATSLITTGAKMGIASRISSIETQDAAAAAQKGAAYTPRASVRIGKMIIGQNK